MKAGTKMCQQIFFTLAQVNFLLKCFQNLFSFALASKSGFGAAISHAVVRNPVVFCESVSADRSAIVASRLLRALAAVVILFLLQLDLEP